jgi:hypothetical protein
MAARGPGGLDLGTRLGDLEGHEILIGALAGDPQYAAFTTRVIDKILAGHLVST